MALKVQSFTLKGIDIDIMYNRGSLAYTFLYDGKTYGISLKVETKTIENIVACTFQLLTHALESLEAIKSHENNGIPTSTEKIR